MSTFTDLEKDAASVDGFVNENGLIPTRRNGPKPSYQYLVDGWNTQINAELDRTAGVGRDNAWGTVQDGIDNTVDGDYFSVVSTSDKNYLDLYKNVSNSAVYQKSYPSTDSFTNIINENNATVVKTMSVYYALKGKVPVKLGKNIFNKGAVILGKYMTLSGQVLSASTLDLSEYITAESGVEYASSHNMRFIVCFDESFKLVAGGVENVTSFTVPANCKYLKVTISHSALSSFQLEVGSVPTTYEPYTEKSALPSDVADNSVTNSSIVDRAVTGGKTAIQTILKENMFNSDLTYISGDLDYSSGTSLSDSSTSSYRGWGNRYSFSSDTLMNAIKVDSSVTTNFTLTLIKSGTVLFVKSVIASDIIDGVVLFPETTFIAGQSYDLILDFDDFKSTGFSDSSVTDISTAIYRNLSGDVLAYPKSASSLFLLQHYSNLNYDVKLTLSSDDIADFEEAVKSVASDKSANKLAVPSKFYAYKSIPNQYNYKHLVKYPDRNGEIVRIEGYNVKAYKHKAEKVSNVAGTGSAEISIFDEDFNTLQNITFDIVTGDANNIVTTKNIVCIGDSLTEGGRWINKSKQLLGTKVNFNGIIQSLEGDVNNFSEGRSGWTLGGYFAMNKAATGYHSPFMHPVNKQYFGVVEKNAAQIASSGRGGMSAKLAEIGFESSGYPSSPTTSSVVYSVANARYETWSGSAWVDAGLTDSDFEFNFSTYRSVWEIPATDAVYIMLGTNDFRALDPQSVDAAFASYKALLDEVIASIKSDNASTDIGIGIANTYVGSDDNNGGFFTAKQTRSMWESRKNKIAFYDNREGESIYVVDWGVVFDTEFGFDKVEETPFTDYIGVNSLVLDGNTPHPGITNNGYWPMGNVVAGWISSL